MDVRQTEDENKPLLSLYDRFAYYVTCSHCIFLKGSGKIWNYWCRGCVRGIRSLQWVRDVSGELKCL